MGFLWRINWKVADVSPHCLELPTKALGSFGVVGERQQLIDQTGDDIGAERKTRAPIVRLLALEPGTLEKRFVRQDVRRRPNLTEQPLRRIQGASFR
jgi:hypothetical protein